MNTISASVRGGIGVWGPLAGAGLAAAAATRAQPLPVFDLAEAPVFAAPESPGPIAVTPPGFDLVGTLANADPAAADGFPEVAVGSTTTGTVRVYRNEADWAFNPAGSLSFLSQVDVFGDIGLPVDPGNTILHGIEFVNFSHDDTLADLLVAAEYVDESGEVDVRRGVVAHFQSRVDGVGQVFFDLIDTEYVELPVTGFGFVDCSNDGRTDIVAACRGEVTDDQPLSPQRVFRVRNVVENGVAGRLVRDTDVENQAGASPSFSIAVGDFAGLPFGQVGGPSGPVPDYVTFGGDSAATPGGLNVTLGLGTSGSFVPSATAAVACVDDVQGPGAGGFNFPGERAAPLVAFDPFAGAARSLATLTISDPGLEPAPGQIRLLHNAIDRFGNERFFHLCTTPGSASVDLYNVRPCIPPNCNQTPLQNVGEDLAAANLNGDLFDDLVYIEQVSGNMAFLLGRGVQILGQPIMNFDRTSIAYYLNDGAEVVPYHNSGGSGILQDRVRAADLDLDGDDEIIVARALRWSSSPDVWNFRVFVNLTQ